jgi:hypothetical protein
LSVPCFARLVSSVKPKVLAFWGVAFLLGCTRPQPTGVKPCDAYVERFEACLKKLPDDEQTARAGEVEAMRKVFRDEAERPESRNNLGTYCEAALSALQGCP